MGELIEFSPNPNPNPNPSPVVRTPPFREDCWSEDATWTLVDAWGTRFVDLNRGNLRQKDWQFVADAVNGVHGHDVKSRRTDVQCKNRIDTLKKKYKAEKARACEGGAGGGGYVSTWPFFQRMDELIGSVVKTVSPPMGIPLPYRRTTTPLAVAQPLVQPVAQPVVQQMPVKRAAPSPPVDDSYFRRNYSAVAAAAAAEVEDDDDVEDSDSSEEENEEVGNGDGMKRLKRAIERFSSTYERVEGEKQRQMIELEKQRMQFVKDMEVQRMQLYMETQVEVAKIKKAKRSGSNDFCS